MKQLISMTDFVIDQSHPDTLEKDDFEQSLYLIRMYAEFLKQLLELWMFIPCNEDGNVLDEPKKCYDCNLRVDCYTRNHTSGTPDYTCHSDWKEYQQAKEKCLFERFEIREHFGDKCLYSKDCNSFFGHFDKEDFCFYGKIIEDLLKYNLQLTQTAIKQTGL